MLKYAVDRAPPTSGINCNPLSIAQSNPVSIATSSTISTLSLKLVRKIWENNNK